MEEKNVNFEELGISKKVLSALSAMGFEAPSPIQSETIPHVMNGKDIIGQAQTGTGKTAAFGIPLVEKVTPDKAVQALVLTPTRELAIQVAEEIANIGKLKRVRVLPVYGGQPIDRQIRAIRAGAQIVIGTPGRLLDHIRRQTLRLDKVQMVVMDEADEMLDMGFVEDIESILSHTPEESRQTLLFSATMPAAIASLAKRYMKDPFTVTISREQLTVPAIEQFYYETRDKLEALCRVLDLEETGKSIVFCRTKKGVDDLVASLQTRGYLVDGLHGDLSQNQRDRVMKQVRIGKLDILVATDVAARGIDIDDITHVINYDIPQDHESYVHRIGRTGRAGRTGVALTFINPREFRQLKSIERATHSRLVRRAVPSASDVLKRHEETLKERLGTLISRGNLDEYISIVEEMAERYDTVDVAAAAMKLAQEGFKLVEETPVVTENPEGMVRLFLNVGRAQNIRPEDIVRAIATEADIPGKVIGMINIYDRFTFVEVPQNMADRVMSVMHKGTIKGYQVNVEPAKGKR